MPDPRHPIHFLETAFEAKLHCAGLLFPRWTNFEDAAFSGRADFEGATFLAGVELAGATFCGRAFFRDAAFYGQAGFRGATFSRGASFVQAAFNGSANFTDAAFSGGTSFRGAVLSDEASISGAAFSGEAIFRDAAFKSSTTFRGARFETEPPRFYGAALHEDTDWTDIAWPGRPGDRDAAIEHRRAYERLKLLMADQNKFADEHFFLRRELECREIEEPGSLRTLASRVFGLLSDYGWSVERPLAALGVAWAVGAVVLFLGEWADFWLGSWPDPDHPPEFVGPGQAAALSFSNLFAFLGLGLHVMRDELASLTAFSEVVAGAQMVAGPILLFLLALGLRNRFRIK